MSNIVKFASFNLKKGASVSDYLLVTDKFNSVFLSAQKVREVTRFRLEDRLYE